jgi:hypothetical protein
MAKQLLETDLRPATPTPSSDSPSDGMAEARSLAKRYMSDAVRLLAGIAFAPDSEAALHTRLMAAKQLIEVAGIVQPTPVAPSHDGASSGGRTS